MKTKLVCFANGFFASALSHDHPTTIVKHTPIPHLTLAWCLCLLSSGISTTRAQIGPGQALQFDGLASEVQVPASALMTISNQLTFEAWIHPQKQDCNT